MPELESPINIEKGEEGPGKKPEEGEIPAGVLEKAREYGVQPSQWQQYGQQIQQEYDRIVKAVMSEYQLLDKVEQEKIIHALQSGDDSALDQVLATVQSSVKEQDRALPGVMNNLKKVAAKKILEQYGEGDV